MTTTKLNGTAARESVAVVGAGPGGLGLAMLLAGRGVPVTVYEAAAEVGGRTGSIQRDGYTFDKGPTFFLMPYVLDEIFAATGRRLSDYVELTRLDPMYRLEMGRENGAALRLDCTQDIAEMGRRIGAIDERDGANFAAFIANNRTKLRVFEPILRKPIRTLTDLIDPKMVAALPHLHPTKSVNAYLKGYFRNPFVQMAVSFQSKYLGMSPYNCPSLFSILPFIEYEYGIWHVRGGLNSLTKAMARACTEMGVEIRCGEPVERITFSGKRADGVVVGGQRRTHGHVALNADAAWAIKNLIPSELRRGLGSWSDKRLDGMNYSCSTYMLYLGVDRPVELPHHTIYISRDYKGNLADISQRGVLSSDPSLYVCNPARLDPSMAPAGHSALYVLVPVANLKDGKIDWARQKADLRGQALARVSQLAGFDVTRHIRTEVEYTPEDWRSQNIHFGATFNLAHGLNQMLHLRPQHELAGVENVWTVGGGTHPGSGLPVIFLSSQIAAGKLAERLGVKANWPVRNLPASQMEASPERPAVAV
jgi:phytoene desaturase